MIVVGHRGWVQEYPENTLAAFRAAIELGVDAVECDVHLTADGELAVIHDADTSRTTGEALSVREVTLAELKRLDAGRWFDERFTGERIPTLEEVMALAAGHVGLYVEVKSPGETTGRVNARLAPLVRSYPGDLIVQSFDADYLRSFRATCPEIPAGYLCRASQDSLDLAVELGCTGYHAAWQSLDVLLNRAAHDAGLTVYVWTADSEDDCRDILDSLEVDAIGADCPDVLLRLVEGSGRR